MANGQMLNRLLILFFFSTRFFISLVPILRTPPQHTALVGMTTQLFQPCTRPIDRF
jgi:hypothetical protein